MAGVARWLRLHEVAAQGQARRALRAARLQDIGTQFSTALTTLSRPRPAVVKTSCWLSTALTARVTAMQRVPGTFANQLCCTAAPTAACACCCNADARFPAPATQNNMARTKGKESVPTSSVKEPAGQALQV